MRKIKRPPNKVVFYEVYDINEDEDAILGPYCREVKWPKNFKKFYIIKGIFRKRLI